jgi:hypothetical protein
VLIGGLQWVPLVGPGVLNDAWAWNGSSWAALPFSGPAFVGEDLVYDSARQKLIIVGRTLATSALGTTTWQNLDADTAWTGSVLMAALNGRLFIYGAIDVGFSEYTPGFFFLPPP